MTTFDELTDQINVVTQYNDELASLRNSFVKKFNHIIQKRNTIINDTKSIAEAIGDDSVKEMLPALGDVMPELSEHDLEKLTDNNYMLMNKFHSVNNNDFLPSDLSELLPIIETHDNIDEEFGIIPNDSIAGDDGKNISELYMEVCPETTKFYTGSKSTNYNTMSMETISGHVPLRTSKLNNRLSPIYENEDDTYAIINDDFSEEEIVL